MSTLTKKDENKLKIAQIIFSIDTDFSADDIVLEIKKKNLGCEEPEVLEVLQTLTEDKVILYGFRKYRNVY